MRRYDKLILGALVIVLIATVFFQAQPRVVQAASDFVSTWLRANIAASSDGVSLKVEYSPTSAITGDYATLDSVEDVLDVERTASGTPANGIGTGVTLSTETTAGNVEIGVTLDAITTDVTAASEDFDFVVGLMDAGTAAAERFRVTSDGVVTLKGAATLDNATAAGRLDLTEDVIDQSGWRAMSIVTTSAQSYSLASAGKAGMVIQTAGEAATLHLMTDLLTSPGAGGWFVVKTGDASDIVIDTQGAETIEGADTYTIDGTLEAVTIATDGTNYHVIGSYLE